jgi:hypothetical protein
VQRAVADLGAGLAHGHQQLALADDARLDVHPQAQAVVTPDLRLEAARGAALAPEAGLEALARRLAALGGERLEDLEPDELARLPAERPREGAVDVVDAPVGRVEDGDGQLVEEAQGVDVLEGRAWAARSGARRAGSLPASGATHRTSRARPPRLAQLPGRPGA